MITIILICVAAICKALSDTLCFHNEYFVKKFPKRNTDFWKINVVSKKVKTIFRYPLDAWHISNSIGICCFLATIFTGDILNASIRVHPAVNYCLYGIIFCAVFNLFYYKIFR